MSAGRILLIEDDLAIASALVLGFALGRAPRAWADAPDPQLAEAKRLLA